MDDGKREKLQQKKRKKNEVSNHHQTFDSFIISFYFTGLF